MLAILPSGSLAVAVMRNAIADPCKYDFCNLIDLYWIMTLGRAVSRAVSRAVAVTDDCARLYCQDDHRPRKYGQLRESGGFLLCAFIVGVSIRRALITSHV